MLVLVALVLLIVFLCVAIGMMSSSSKANKLAQEKIRLENAQKKREQQEKESAGDKEFNETWEVMARYDADVRAQVERLGVHGSGAVDELKRAYKVTMDKNRIPEFTDQIISDIQSGRLELDAEDSGDKTK